MDDVIILGAGIVGIATGIHLLKRGRSVVLVDKSAPGRETSFGNAGIIQREGVRPHAFPRDLHTLLQVGLHFPPRRATSRWPCRASPRRCSNTGGSPRPSIIGRWWRAMRR